MKCPVCEGVDLVMSERQGVEIDYCPKCRGIWLDRGELDKILEKAAVNDREIPPPTSPIPREYRKYEPDDYYKYKKRKHWLSELFD